MHTSNLKSLRSKSNKHVNELNSSIKTSYHREKEILKILLTKFTELIIIDRKEDNSRSKHARQIQLYQSVVSIHYEHHRLGHGFN